MIDDECWENMAPLLDDTPRRLAPRSFTAHCEREPGRLQLRLVLARDEHVDDIVVDEEDDRIVAFAAVCSPTIGADPEQMEGPFHVYLEEPVGERRVIDALSGRELPYRNVLAELAEEYGLNGNGASIERGDGLSGLSPLHSMHGRRLHPRSQDPLLAPRRARGGG